MSGTHPTNLSNNIIDRFWENGETEWDYLLFNAISSTLQRALKTGFQKKVDPTKPPVNIDYQYGTPDPAFMINLEKNLYHFSAAETLSQIRDLNQALNEAKDYNDFKNKAQKIVEVYRRYLKTEYFSAVNTSEAASRFLDLKRKSNVLPLWKYTTAGDEKVRKEHAKLDGVVLRHDDPLWDKIYPPNGWRCRCYVVGILESDFTEDLGIQQDRVKEFMSTPEWEKEVAQGWGVNKALDNEIFSENQMYIRKFKNNAASYLKNIAPDKWGLTNSLKKLQAESTAKIDLFDVNVNEYWISNSVPLKSIGDIERISFDDYLNRKWILTEKAFNAQVNEKGSNKAQYLNELESVIKSPSEVWLGQGTKDSKELTNYIFIKHYSGSSIAVDCTVENDQLVIKSWSQLTDPYKRSGLLIYKSK